MNGPVVVVSDANLLPLRGLLEDLLPPGSRVRWPVDEQELVTALRGADVYVGSRLTRELGAAARTVRLVHVAAAGVDGIAPDAVPSGAVVANTFHHEDSIAEYLVAVTVMLRRHLLDQDRALRDGRWTSSRYDPSVPQVGSLAAATVGFVGFGHIGARAWQAIARFGARGLAVSRSGVDAAAHGLDWGGTVDELDTLLDRSDVVVLCLPLVPGTERLIGADELLRMGPTAVLVNVARAGVVDEVSLHRALSDGVIAGAALDVWYHYPAPGEAIAAPARHDFAALTNVIMTPHVAGVTRQTFEGRAGDIADNVRRLVAGEPLRNVVVG